MKPRPFCSGTILDVDLRDVLRTMTVTVLASAALMQPTLAGQGVPAKHAVGPCRPEALRDFCRVGCADPAPVEAPRIVPSLREVRPPLPSGIVILELGVDRSGHAVSACILRGVRTDFDQAAQTAALESRWKFPQLKGRERGFVFTLIACTPDRSAACTRRLIK